jgi:error-prone DNA polymerase
MGADRADYRMTGITLGEHPMELLRPGLPADSLTSEGLRHTRDGARVKVAGMVVARQRPATANGVVFMLLEDERGTINLIVPPPVVERCRLAVRTSGFVQAAGKLEHREGTTNVVVSVIERLERPDLPPAKPRHIAPPIPHETGRRDPVPAALSKRAFDGVREAAMAELAASLPTPHSFGRRGR